MTTEESECYMVITSVLIEGSGVRITWSNGRVDQLVQIFVNGVMSLSKDGKNPLTSAEIDEIIGNVVLERNTANLLARLFGTDGAITFQNVWNATTNVPTLASGIGGVGDVYVVSVAGSTSLDGIANWQLGDWAVFNGTIWQKVDNTSSLLRSSTPIITFKPGTPSLVDSGVYGTWTELMTIVDTLNQPVVVQFDDSTASVVIPAGNHVFPHGSVFAGKFNLPFVQVTFDDGATLEGVRSFIRGIAIENQNTTDPVMTITGPAPAIVTFERGAEPRCTGTTPLIRADGAGTFVVVALYGGQVIDGGVGQAVFEATNGASVIINPVVASTIETNTLAADGTSGMSVTRYGDTSYALTQPDVVGGVTITVGDVSAQVGFDPATAGNQLAATFVQSAIDELTNKHVNSRSTTYDTAGTFAVAANDPKLILVDASGIGGGVINVDLPDPADDSGPWKIKRVDNNGSATVNIRGTGGASVDGAASQVLDVSPDGANLETDGTDWWRI